MPRTDLKTDIIIPAEFWGTTIFPEGLLESWIVADDSMVEAGEPVAAVRVEGALHHVMAPATGELRIGCHPNSLIEPGSIIGRIL